MHAVTVLSTRSGMLAGRKAYKALDDNLAYSATYFAIYHMVSMSSSINNDDPGSLCRVKKGRLQLLFGVVSELLCVLEMDVRLSTDATACIRQNIQQDISKMPVGSSLNGKLPLDDMSNSYGKVMQRLFDQLRTHDMYFQSKRIALVLSCPQITAIMRGDSAATAVHVEAANTEPLSMNGVNVSSEHAQLIGDISDSSEFKHHISRMQHVHLLLRKYTRCILSPCCANTSGMVAPHSPAVDPVQEAPRVLETKARFTCRYMHPEGGHFEPSAVTTEDATSAGLGVLGSGMHAPSLTKDIICALNDFLVDCAGVETSLQRPLREFMRFVYNSSTKRVRCPSNDTSKSNRLDSTNCAKAEFAEEVRAATKVDNNPSAKGHGTRDMKSSGKGCGVSQTGAAPASSLKIPQNPLMQPPIEPLQTDPDDLELLFITQTGLMLVCQPVVGASMLDSRRANGDDVDVESQYLSDFLIMADSCLQHTLLHSVRELPID